MMMFPSATCSSIAERLLDRTSARLEKAADTDRRLRSAIDEHVAEGNIIIPHRKTRQHINRLLRDDER
jgi:hypothetical protein